MAEPNSILTGRQVLIADDESFSLSIVTRMVRDLGCAEPVLAKNGIMALQHLQLNDDDISLLLLDFNMPDANGLQVLKALRTGKTRAARDTQVVMLTGSSDFSLVGAAMALDVDAFVIKPVSKVTLASRLEKVFQESREIKPVAAYMAVDIDSVTKRMLSNKPVGTPRPKSETQKAGPSGMRMKLDSVPVGAVLSEHIRSPTGELLVGRATVLNERLIRRLKELNTVIGLEYVYVLPPVAPKEE